MSSKNNQYSNTLNEILHDVVGNALRDIFKTEWDSLFPQTPWNDDQNSLQDFENKEKSGPNWKSNKPRMPDTGNCNEWDLTKVFFVLLYSHTIDLKSRDPQRYGNIDQIRQIRNARCHPKSAGLSKATFENHYNNIKTNLTSLGCIDAIQEMERIRYSDKVATQKDLRFIWLAIGVIAVLLSLSAPLLYSFTSNEVIPSPHETQTRAYFPEAKKPPYFKGRDKEVAEITWCLLNRSYSIVSIIGSPAFGKTSLSVAIGQYLRDKHNFRVVFVELRGINSTTNSSRDILHEKVAFAFGHEYAGQNDFKDMLHKQTDQATLMIIDNVEDALILPMREYFIELLKDIISVNNITVLSTSRKKFDVIGTSVYEVRIDALDSNSATSVMKELYPDITDDLALRIANLTGGIPLLLEIFGSQLRSGFREAEDLISTIEGANAFVAAEETEDLTNSTNLYKLLKMVLDRVDCVHQELFIVVSAASTLPMDFPQEAVDTLTCNIKHNLSPLVNVCLLKRFKSALGDVRYEMHPVIQTFGLLVSKENHWWKQLSLAAQQSSLYYTNQMLSLVQSFQKKVHALLHSVKVTTDSEIDKLFGTFKRDSQRAFNFFGWDQRIGFYYKLFGILYHRAHNYESAINSSKEALRIYEAVYGNHRETAFILNQLSKAYLFQFLPGQEGFQEAIDYFNRSYNMFNSTSGLPPEIALTAYGLGEIAVAFWVCSREYFIFYYSL